MKSEDIRFRNENENSAKNFNSVVIGNTRFYFSYETLVAFTHPTKGFIALQNYWGPTTGKHLNWIGSDKEKRKTQKEFDELLKDVQICDQCKSFVELSPAVVRKIRSLMRLDIVSVPMNEDGCTEDCSHFKENQDQSFSCSTHGTRYTAEEVQHRLDNTNQPMNEDAGLDESFENRTFTQEY